MHRALQALALTGALIGAQTAHATVVLQTTLSGANQVPAIVSPATGSAIVTLENDNTTLDVAINWTGLSSLGEFGHIHCCTAAGTNTGVALDFGPLPNATSAVFNQSYNLSTFPFGNGQTEASFITGIESGLAYVNIHNDTFPNGEIRGQLQLVPEPGTAALLCGAVLGAVALSRRNAGRTGVPA